MKRHWGVFTALLVCLSWSLSGQTLWDAAEKGDTTEVRRFVEKIGMSPDKLNAKGQSALGLAIASRSWETALYLVEKGALVSLPVEYSGKVSGGVPTKIPAYWAAALVEEGEAAPLNLLETLVAHGADFKGGLVLDRTKDLGFKVEVPMASLFQICAALEDLAPPTAEDLNRLPRFTAGKTFQKKLDSEFWHLSPLTLEILGASTQERLLRFGKAGVDPNLAGGGLTPLLVAVQKGESWGRLLLQMGANPNQGGQGSSQQGSTTPLLQAIRYQPTLVEPLLDAGADPNKTQGKLSPLQAAALLEGRDGYNIASELIARGAKVQALVPGTKTTVFEAVLTAQFGQGKDPRALWNLIPLYQVNQMLPPGQAVRFKPKAMSAELKGQVTPLTLAVLAQDEEETKHLVQEGAVPTTTDIMASLLSSNRSLAGYFGQAGFLGPETVRALIDDIVGYRPAPEILDFLAPYGLTLESRAQETSWPVFVALFNAQPQTLGYIEKTLGRVSDADYRAVVDSGLTPLIEVVARKNGYQKRLLGRTDDAVLAETVVSDFKGSWMYEAMVPWKQRGSFGEQNYLVTPNGRTELFHGNSSALKTSRRGSWVLMANQGGGMKDESHLLFSSGQTHRFISPSQEDRFYGTLGGSVFFASNRYGGGMALFDNGERVADGVIEVFMAPGGIHRYAYSVAEVGVRFPGSDLTIPSKTIINDHRPAVVWNGDGSSALVSVAAEANSKRRDLYLVQWGDQPPRSQRVATFEVLSAFAFSSDGSTWVAASRSSEYNNDYTLSTDRGTVPLTTMLDPAERLKMVAYERATGRLVVVTTATRQGQSCEIARLLLNAGVSQECVLTKVFEVFFSKEDHWLVTGQTSQGSGLVDLEVSTNTQTFRANHWVQKRADGTPFYTYEYLNEPSTITIDGAEPEGPFSRMLAWTGTTPEGLGYLGLRKTDSGWELVQNNRALQLLPGDINLGRGFVSVDGGKQWGWISVETRQWETEAGTGTETTLYENLFSLPQPTGPL